MRESALHLMAKIQFCSVNFVGDTVREGTGLRVSAAVAGHDLVASPEVEQAEDLVWAHHRHLRWQAQLSCC